VSPGGVCGEPESAGSGVADEATGDREQAQPKPLKAEFYYRRIWPTKARARVEVDTWIEDRYNRRRRSGGVKRRR